jgi:hypothetical protein
VTKKFWRNHKEKKEYELLERVDTYHCSQSDLAYQIAKVLGCGPNSLRNLANSPYLYETDIHSCVLLKHAYRTKYPDRFTPFSVATLDLETSLDDKSILIATVAMQDKLVTCVRKDFLKEHHYHASASIKQKLKELCPQPEMIERMEIHVHVLDTELDIVKKLFAYIHQWQPDFVAIWNIAFDMNIIIQACERANNPIEDLLCDPRLDKKYRYFNYNESPPFKVTDSGKRVTIPVEERWHTVRSSSSFYFIDAMCAYARIRIGSPKVPGGYSLDNILSRELNLGKLKLPEADHLVGIQWHRYMQKQYPIEYVVYNQWDCLSMLALESKTKDLSFTLPTLAGDSEFNSLLQKYCFNFR